MFIVVGLGNPGREYARTRHNVGFDVIDVLSEKHHIQLTKNAMHGQIGEGRARFSAAASSSASALSAGWSN